MLTALRSLRQRQNERAFDKSSHVPQVEVSLTELHLLVKCLLSVWIRIHVPVCVEKQWIFVCSMETT